MPEEYTYTDGRTKYVPYIDFDRERMDSEDVVRIKKRAHQASVNDEDVFAVIQMEVEEVTRRRRERLGLPPYLSATPKEARGGPRLLRLLDARRQREPFWRIRRWLRRVITGKEREPYSAKSYLATPEDS